MSVEAENAPTGASPAPGEGGARGTCTSGGRRLGQHGGRPATARSSRLALDRNPLLEAGSAWGLARGRVMAAPGWGPPRLDGFILTERLGSGTYATVYKAYAKVGAGRGRSRPGACQTLSYTRDGKRWAVRDTVRAVRCPQSATSGPDHGWMRWELTATFLSLKQTCLHTPALSAEAGKDTGGAPCQ